MVSYLFFTQLSNNLRLQERVQGIQHNYDFHYPYTHEKTFILIRFVFLLNRVISNVNHSELFIIEWVKVPLSFLCQHNNLSTHLKNFVIILVLLGTPLLVYVYFYKTVFSEFWHKMLILEICYFYTLWVKSKLIYHKFNVMSKYCDLITNLYINVIHINKEKMNNINQKCWFLNFMGRLQTLGEKQKFYSQLFS